MSMDQNELMAKFARGDDEVLEVLVCLDSVGSQKWAGLVMGVIARDGNEVIVKVLKTSPNFPKWVIGHVGPMSMSYYQHAGGRLMDKQARRTAGGLAHKSSYTEDEIFGDFQPLTRTSSEDASR